MSAFLEWVKPFASFLVALIPSLRRLKVERNAGANPSAALTDSADKLLDGALGRLGAVSVDDTHWERLSNGIAAAFVRPEHFSKPHLREWISHPDANAALRRVTKARLASAPERTEDSEMLLSIYMGISGEHRSYAESNLHAAVSFLAASVVGTAKDAGNAAISQAGFAAVQDRFDSLDAALELQSNMACGAVAEHHGRDARSRLDSILRRRATTGAGALDELGKLLLALDRDGEFAAAPSSLRAETLDWIARISASLGQLPKAEAALAELAKLGREPSPPARAWTEAGRGNVDEALQLLAKLDTADCRSSIFGILRAKKGDVAALAYLDSLDGLTAETLTPGGWTNVATCLVEGGNLDRAASVISSLPPTMVKEWPLLGYMGGMIYASNSISPEIRERALHMEYLSAANHLLDGAGAEEWRAKAHSSFEVCLRVSEEVGDDDLARHATGWLRWLRLVDPARRDGEVTALISEMNDGERAVDLIPLAHAFSVRFDPSALERRLDRAQLLGGLSPKEINAKVMLLIHTGRYAELASFIEDNWDRLSALESQEALGGTLVSALAQAGECSKAEEALAEKLEKLHSADVPRFRLMISQCRGEDPTNQAREVFEASGQMVDLANLVMSLETHGRWSEMDPFAFELFSREPNTVNARRHAECMRRSGVSDEDQLCFFDKWPDLVAADMDLMSARSWALFHLGRVSEAFDINNRLLQKRFGVNDVALDVNLAVRMGDWERIPAILEREWKRKDQLPVELLLHMSRVASSRARERSLEMVRESIGRSQGNPRALLQAYSVASGMGRDDIAMPLVSMAAELSKDGEGPVMSLSFREIVEMMKDSAEDWRKKNELFRSGTVPIHWSAGVLNVPLTRLLIAIPRENQKQADARRRQPIPIISGARHRVRASGVRKLALDITSVFILGELGILRRLIDAMDRTMLSPRFMESLLFEEEKVRFHQPSRIEEAKPLLDLRRRGLLEVLSEDGPSSLIEEVGGEMGALLAAAKSCGGVCVHSGKLYRAGSYMDAEAELGEFVGSLSSPSAIARMLHDEARVTSSVRDTALEYLDRVDHGGGAGVSPSLGAPVFLDRVSAQYLSGVGLLERLVNSNRTVFVHAEALEEWQSLVDTEGQADAMVQVLEGIREVVRDGVANGKVGFLREGKNDDGDGWFGFHGQPMIDLFEDVGGVDAVCIDDRLLNSKEFIEDRRGGKAPLLCSLDVIDMLVEIKSVTAIERSEALHLMREFCFMALPVEDIELLGMLSNARADGNGVLVESAGLRVVREYLARLHASDFLCSESDLEYMDELWRTGQRVLRRIWADDKSGLVDVVARADWVVDHMVPDVELALRFAVNGRERMEELAVGRLFASLLPAFVPEGRGDDYSRWLENKIIAPHLPACGAVLRKASRQVGVWAIQRSVEIANEIGSGGGKEDGQGDAGNGGQCAPG
jgi:tetratricopeptide (TPR) repeat protein